MTEMIICGLSMEMEMAKEMGTIGKCKGCLYLNWNNGDYCSKLEEPLEELRENCDSWVVDHR